jgi:hypothetical protein
MPNTPPKRELLYFATNKEIHDLIIQGPQMFPKEVLLDLTRARGLFLSPVASREELAAEVALLPFDYASLALLLGRAQRRQSAEKLTTETFSQTLKIEDIKKACEGYATTNVSDEKVTVRQTQDGRVIATVTYTELDTSKTELLQRRRREAEIQFLPGADGTEVRMPFNEKAREILRDVTQRINALTSQPVTRRSIEVSHLKTAKDRTDFFLHLITGLPDFKLYNVTHLKVEIKIAGGQPKPSASEAKKAKKKAKETFASTIENIAIKGHSLLTSPEYLELTAKGFFITNINWTASRITSPYEIVEFVAAFEEGAEGTGFKYNVGNRYPYLQSKSSNARTPQPIPKGEQTSYIGLLEQTARNALDQVGGQSDKMSS